MKISDCMHNFFDRYLQRMRGLSGNTVDSYRDTFKLLLKFAAGHCGVKLKALMLEHLTFGVICRFLDHLESDRQNSIQTRNQRLAALKSFAKMTRLFYSEKRRWADKILSIPSKRTQKHLVGFLNQEEMELVFKAVELKVRDGFRDYVLLHLLYNSGARASEVASLTLDSFDSENRTLGIVGKGNKYRIIELWPKTVGLLTQYIENYRRRPKPLYRQRLFINQRGGGLTRQGIYKIGKKYLTRALPPKMLEGLHPVHSFRHSCAMYLREMGWSLTEIMNFLGHQNIQSLMVYLKLDIRVKRKAQKQFIAKSESLMTHDPKLDELLDWWRKEETLKWLDSL